MSFCAELDIKPWQIPDLTVDQLNQAVAQFEHDQKEAAQQRAQYQRR